jgi:hypothetical protein
VLPARMKVRLVSRFHPKFTDVTSGQVPAVSG